MSIPAAELVARVESVLASLKTAPSFSTLSSEATQAVRGAEEVQAEFESVYENLMKELEAELASTNAEISRLEAIEAQWADAHKRQLDEQLKELEQALDDERPARQLELEAKVASARAEWQTAQLELQLLQNRGGLSVDQMRKAALLSIYESLCVDPTRVTVPDDCWDTIASLVRETYKELPHTKS